MSDKILDFITKLKDKYGEASVVTTESHLEGGVISTGSLSLDISLGIGGIPRGMFTEVVGPESSGKTTTCLSIVKQAIEQDLNVLYIDVERALDFRYIRAVVGEFDEDRLVLASPETAEDAFSVAEDGIDSEEFGLIILDSLGALAPQKELDDDLTDANVALLPRLLTKWLRRNSYKVKKNNIAFVFVNQVRDNIGSYVGGYVSPGGHALKHFLAVVIKFTKGQRITKGSGKDSKIIGVLTNFSIQKNKLAPPFRGATLPIIFGEGIDYLGDVLEIARRLGVVRLAGSHYKFGDDALGQGKDNAKQYLSTNKETLDKIIKMCYDIVDSVSEGVDDE